MITSIVLAVSIVQNGRYQVTCDGEFLSEHNAYRKAIEVAVNANAPCQIKAPNVTVIPDEEPSSTPPTTQKLFLSWEIPTQREDGTALPLNEIQSYEVYAGVSTTDMNHFQTIINADTRQLTIDPWDTTATHFKIRTIDSTGIAGAFSDTITAP